MSKIVQREMSTSGCCGLRLVGWVIPKNAGTKRQKIGKIQKYFKPCRVVAVTSGCCGARPPYAQKNWSKLAKNDEKILFLGHFWLKWIRLAVVGGRSENYRWQKVQNANVAGMKK